MLLVRESKFNKSRYVPLHDSALQALARYARRRDELCPAPRDESFFVSLHGLASGESERAGPPATCHRH